MLIPIYICSCQNSRTSNKVYCEITESIEEYPDSSFFSSISLMEYSGGKLYILDEKRGDIVCLNENLKKMEYVSRHGEAPYEVVMPITFSVKNDTVYIVDLGTRSMKKYYKGLFIDNFSLSNANENRFSINESHIFLSATTDTTSYLKIPLDNPSQQRATGGVTKESTPKRTIMLNQKHILYSNGTIYSVSGNYPYIHTYNTNGKLTNTFDISSIPVIKNALEYAKSLPYQENSYYIYIMDAYLTHDYLYLLCSSRSTSEGYKVNTVLKLSINDEMTIHSTYILPHDYYSTFCISDSHIFAAQTGRICTIEKIAM